MKYSFMVSLGKFKCIVIAKDYDEAMDKAETYYIDNRPDLELPPLSAVGQVHVQRSELPLIGAGA